MEGENFEVFHSMRRILTKEEVLNMFYPYRNAQYFPDIKEHMLTADSLVLLLVNKTETVWNDEKQEYVKLDSPIGRLKKLIGDKDPNLAK